jgi:histidinol-phosphate aminotransferase
MSLIDYYRQFRDISQEEINRALRARRRREKALALQEVPELDLSGTEWPEFPNPEVINASIFTARGRVNGYPDRHATALRRTLAERHRVEPEQIVLGNGAAELLQAAALALMSEDDELLTPWPSYPLYPLMATRAGARPVPVALAGGRADPEALRAAVRDRTRVLVICNPNDPTGTYMPSDAIGALISSLPERVHVLLDEALIQFQDVEDEDAGLRLVDAFPRLLVFRSFSKIYGLSGLRAGYAVGSTASTGLLESIAPVLGVNALTQSAIAQALKIGGPEVALRRAAVIRERRRLTNALHGLPLDAPESQANFLWLHAPRLTGAQLAARLDAESIIVAPGGPLGDEDHVRVAVRDARATDRLLSALERAVSV